jgi:hypothetical protein
MSLSAVFAMTFDWTMIMPSKRASREHVASLAITPS